MGFVGFIYTCLCCVDNDGFIQFWPESYHLEDLTKAYYLWYNPYYIIPQKYRVITDFIRQTAIPVLGLCWDYVGLGGRIWWQNSKPKWADSAKICVLNSTLAMLIQLKERSIQLGHFRYQKADFFRAKYGLYRVTSFQDPKISMDTTETPIRYIQFLCQ